MQLFVLITGCRIVESTGARHFNLSDSEVQSRKRYVRDVRLELEVRWVFSFIYALKWLVKE